MMDKQGKIFLLIGIVLAVFVLFECGKNSELPQMTDTWKEANRDVVEIAEPSLDIEKLVTSRESVVDKFTFSGGGAEVLIGHSFGSIDGNTYTGSLEAFQKKYEEGIRIFEVDFATAADGNIVLRHDWDADLQEGISSENIPTSEEFKKILIKGKYTPLTFIDLLQLMEEYPDIWIVTDSKATEEDEVRTEFTEMVSEAQESEMLDVLDRFIVQIYNEKMYDTVKEVYPFSEYIFTLYMRWGGELDEFENICRWCVVHNVKNITMWNFFYNERIKMIAQKYNIDIYVHTENNPLVGKNYLMNGVRGLYTDDLTGDMLNEYSDLVKAIFFSEKNYNAKDYVYEGLSWIEGEFSWTKGNEVGFWIPIEGSDSLQVEMIIGGIYGEAQRYNVVQDDIIVAKGELTTEGTISFTTSVRDGLCIFQIELPDAISPNEWDGGEDMRCLALQLKQVLLYRIN